MYFQNMKVIIDYLAITKNKILSYDSTTSRSNHAFIRYTLNETPHDETQYFVCFL